MSHNFVAVDSGKPIELKWTKLPIISNTECKSKWDKFEYYFSDNEMFCAGFLKNNSTLACHGDSGGPLICHQNGQTVLAGIVSWGKERCETHLPNVFARVSNYLEWIQKYMEKTSTSYLRTKKIQEYDNLQDHGDVQDYDNAQEYRDSQEIGNSQGKVSTYGLKQALQQISGSCPKLPNYMRGGAQGRIINGHRANSPIPWQVSLQKSSGFHFCGGTILDKTTVVTAAHCLDGKGDIQLYILAGSVSKKSKSVKIRIDKLIIHPQWSSYTMANDVAIIKLSRPLTFGKTIQPMCLPSKYFKPRIGGMCIASGWGDTKCKNYIRPKYIEHIKYIYCSCLRTSHGTSLDKAANCEQYRM